MTSPQRLSVQEAADHFGVSASTIRRWIGADELSCEREDTPQGTRVWVHLDAEVEDATEAVAAPTDAAPSALVAALEERVRSLESILATELQAGTELRALLSREQAAHDTTRAELDRLKTQQSSQAVIPVPAAVDQSRKDEGEPAALNALATLRAQYEHLQDAQPQPVERPSLVSRIFGAVGQESVSGFTV